MVVPTFGKTAASVSPCWLAAHAVSNYPMRTHHRVATPLALPGALEQYEDSLSGLCNEVLLVATCGMSCHVFKVWPRGALDTGLLPLQRCADCAPVAYRFVAIGWILLPSKQVIEGTY